MKMAKVAKIVLVVKDGNIEEDVILKTIEKDPNSNAEEERSSASTTCIRPGEPPERRHGARTLLDRLFFNPKRYDLGEVGRYNE